MLGFDDSNSVSMFEENLVQHPSPHWNDDHLYALAPRELHCWDEVGISSNHDNLDILPCTSLASTPFHRACYRYHSRCFLAVYTDLQRII